MFLEFSKGSEKHCVIYDPLSNKEIQKTTEQMATFARYTCMNITCRLYGLLQNL